MNMSKLLDREDIDMLSSDKMVKPKNLYSNIKVAFEVNLSSEGEMDAYYVNITYTLYFFWLNNAAEDRACSSIVLEGMY